ncbi:MAG: carboxypeptidase regulatory-like domain-containing protein, partial [Blastocatellia bacterium]|nr:carboxypeptidase regulatory-like domain-containing protein [Blastocatellia bacterium]
MKDQTYIEKGALLRIARSLMLALVLLTPFSVDAQNITATILGTVSDQSGAPIPGATVVARSSDTGLTRTATTGEDGSYRFEFLPVGNYGVEVTAASGFKKAVQGGIVLRISDITRVDVTLEVGAVSEEVTITSAPPEINTTSSELGRTVQSAEIENLPLVERNVYALLDLTPGVQSNNNGVATASATTSNLSLGFPEQR